MKIGRKLRSVGAGRVMFMCPGCSQYHQVNVTDDPNRQGPIWGYNNNPDAPTFTPSVLVRWPAKPDASEEYAEWRTERICHSFVTDGRIQFLSDCTHGLSGQNVELPDLDED